MLSYFLTYLSVNKLFVLNMYLEPISLNLTIIFIQLKRYILLYTNYNLGYKTKTRNSQVFFKLVNGFFKYKTKCQIRMLRTLPVHASSTCYDKHHAPRKFTMFQPMCEHKLTMLVASSTARLQHIVEQLQLNYATYHFDEHACAEPFSVYCCYNVRTIIRVALRLFD